jgi:hypothetical protein
MRKVRSAPSFDNDPRIDQAIGVYKWNRREPWYKMEPHIRRKVVSLVELVWKEGYTAGSMREDREELAKYLQTLAKKVKRGAVP